MRSCPCKHAGREIRPETHRPQIGLLVLWRRAGLKALVYDPGGIFVCPPPREGQTVGLLISEMTIDSARRWRRSWTAPMVGHEIGGYMLCMGLSQAA